MYSIILTYLHFYAITSTRRLFKLCGYRDLTDRYLIPIDSLRVSAKSTYVWSEFNQIETTQSEKKYVFHETRRKTVFKASNANETNLPFDENPTHPVACFFHGGKKAHMHAPTIHNKEPTHQENFGSHPLFSFSSHHIIKIQFKRSVHEKLTHRSP